MGIDFTQNTVHHNEHKATTHPDRGHARQREFRPVGQLAFDVTGLKCNFTAIKWFIAMTKQIVQDFLTMNMK